MILSFWSDAGDWIGGILESFFLMIDNVVYSFIEQVYELFILISEAGVFSQNTIQQFAGRIYIFLGLIMLFVVSISLVQYILDPKKFSDSKIGGAKLVKDFAFVLIAIIAIPYVFEAAFRLQRIVLKDNIIGSLILGMKYTGQETDDKDNPSYYATYGGKIMAYSAASAFVTLNPEVASYACINQPINDAGTISDACSNLEGIEFDGGYKPGGAKIDFFTEYIENYNENKDFRYLMNKNYVSFEVEKEGSETVYRAIDYSFLMSTIAGGFIVYILLGFCIDIAVRSVKLSFLQLIAPIPLMMKIIPGSGQKKFDAWVKQCVSTYCEIFVKLAAIYFAIFIIAAITTDGIQNVGGSGFVQTNLVRVAIIFGALMFASELPKLLKDILGGSGGNFKLGGPMKKIMSSPFSGAVAGAVGGAALGTLANGYVQKRDWKKNWNSIKNDDSLSRLQKFGKHTRDTFSFAGGGFSGFARGAKGGMTGKSTLYKAATTAAGESSLARNNRHNGYGIKESFGREWSKVAGTKNKMGTIGKQAVEIENLTDDYERASNMQRRMEESYSDSSQRYMLKSNLTPEQLKTFTGRDRDSSTGIYSSDITDAAKIARQDYIDNNLNYEKYEANVNSAKEKLQANYDAYTEYANNVASGNAQEDEAIRAKFEKAEEDLKRELDNAQAEYNTNYEVTKANRKEFDDLMKLDSLQIDYRNQKTKIQKELNTAKANNEKFAGKK